MADLRASVHQLDDEFAVQIDMKSLDLVTLRQLVYKIAAQCPVLSRVGPYRARIRSAKALAALLS